MRLDDSCAFSSELVQNFGMAKLFAIIAPELAAIIKGMIIGFALATILLWANREMLEEVAECFAV